MSDERLAGLRAELDSKSETRDLAKSLDLIQLALADHWSETYLPWFTDHGIRHAKNVADYALDLASLPSVAPAMRLTPLERYILAAAALLHDIGMNDLSLCERPLGEMTPEDNDRVRDDHPVRSGQAILQEPLKWGLPNEGVLVEVVSLVAKAHGTKYYKATLPALEERGYVRNDPVRGTLLAALVLMADELDLHYEREKKLPGGATLNPVSEAHAFKHRCVVASHVQKSTDGTIMIDLNLELPGSIDYLDVDEVRIWIVTKLRRQIGLTEAEFDVGFGKQVRISRTIKVAFKPPLISRPEPSQGACAVIHAETTVNRVLDHKKAVTAAVEGMESAALVIVSGRWQPAINGDIDGREDVYQAALAVAQSRDVDVVVTSSRALLAGASDASDVLEEWLLAFGHEPTRQGRHEKEYREALLITCASEVRSLEATQRLVFAASSIDGLSSAARDWLTGTALPVLVGATQGGASAIVTASPDSQMLTVGMVSVVVPVLVIDTKQLESDLGQYGDHDFVSMVGQADLPYQGLKRIALHAERHLASLQ